MQTRGVVSTFYCNLVRLCGLFSCVSLGSFLSIAKHVVDFVALCFPLLVG